MKLYLAVKEVDYEGDTILGVYDTLKKATTRLDKEPFETFSEKVLKSVILNKNYSNFDIFEKEVYLDKRQKRIVLKGGHSLLAGQKLNVLKDVTSVRMTPVCENSIYEYRQSDEVEIIDGIKYQVFRW